VEEEEEWHEPVPQPSVEPVFPELFAKAVSGTAIRRNIIRVPMIIILVLTLPSSIVVPSYHSKRVARNHTYQ
jgi:hypothetical protein